MNKKLLLLGIAGTILSFGANAQLALETFDHGGALPPGWSMISDGHTVSTSFTGSTAIQDSLDVHAWIPVLTTSSGSDYQMITTSLFSPAATADRWLISPSFTVSSANMVIQWQDYDLNSGENLQVQVSPSAGTTISSFTSMIFNAAAGVDGLVTHQAYVGTWNGTNIRVAFRDNTYNNWGLIIDNVQTALIPSLDLGITSTNIRPFAQNGSSYTFSGVIHNYGAVPTTSIHLNYSVNGGAPVTTSITGLSLPFNTDYSFSSSIPWVPSADGNYTIKVWADNINGSGVDENHSNDTVTKTIIVVDSLKPKTVLIEEFNQASCDPCAAITEHLDTVYHNNTDKSIMVRYHVNFPGRDCMDSVTYAPFVSSRLGYYSIGGVPDAQVDGATFYPGPGHFSSSDINYAYLASSPLTITVNPSFDPSTNTYSFSAAIKAYGTLPAGLKAYAALTIDTITYRANQSTESIPQTVFPEVAENMFPAAGTALSAFTSGSTQTITGSWVKNHPWGSNYSVWPYDSTTHGKIVVWVSDNNKYVYQAGYAEVNTITNGVKNVTGNNNTLEIYPNPASTQATASFSLQQADNISVKIFNEEGQVVYSMPAQQLSKGEHHLTIPLSSLASGAYTVTVSSDSGSMAKRLTIVK